MAGGRDGLIVLSSLPRVDLGFTPLDAVIRRLRALPVPVTLPVDGGEPELEDAVTH